MSNNEPYIPKTKLKDHDEFSIPDDDPYKNDLLGLKSFGNTLKTLVTRVKGSLVLSINGPWGTGKTTFLKMWDQSLKKDGVTTIYFSAWEDDYCDDPLISLVGQVYPALKEGDWKEMGNTLKEVIKPLLGKTVFNILSRLTAGTVDLNDQNLKSCLENAFDDYLESGSVLKSIKSRLKEQSERCLQKNGTPLVIIIDELDRCRPLFAIGLLEKIKHLFDIPGIIFVLGIDRTQLGHSIKSVYGQGMDVDGYLRRFIDLEFLLPGNGDPDVFIFSYLNKLGISSIINDGEKMRNIVHSSSVIAKFFSFSLRDMEYLCRTLMLGSLTVQKIAENHVVPFLVAMKLKDESFYRDMIARKLDAVEIIKRLDEKHKFFQMFEQDDHHIIGSLICFFYFISPKSWKNEIREHISCDNETGNYIFQEVSNNYFHPKVIEYVNAKPRHYLRDWESARYRCTGNNNESNESKFFSYLANNICSISSERDVADIVQWIEFSQFPEN